LRIVAVSDAHAEVRMTRREEILGRGSRRFCRRSPVNSSVLGPDGELVYIIHREDVTEVVRLTAGGAE
jgi:hypothetical protein